MLRWVLAMWFSSLVSFIVSRLVFHLLFHLLSLLSALFVLSCLFPPFVLSCLFSLPSSCLLSSPSIRLVFSLSLSSFSVFVCCCGCVLLVLCLVSCLLCVVRCVVCCCVTRSKRPPCVDSKRPRVCRHHAHMLKHMCAWCRHARRRFGRTHGVHGWGEGVVVILVFFIGKTSDFLNMLSSTLTQCQVHASSPIFCLPRLVHVVITCSRDEPKFPQDLSHFQVWE